MNIGTKLEPSKQVVYIPLQFRARDTICPKGQNMEPMLRMRIRPMLTITRNVLYPLYKLLQWLWYMIWMRQQGLGPMPIE